MDFIRKIIYTLKTVNKKNLILITLCVIVAGALIWYGVSKKSEGNPNQNVVNRGQVAKAVSLLFHGMDEIEGNEDDKFLSDENAWYEKYMNMMYKDTYFGIKDVPPTETEALSSFTYSDLEKLFINIGVVDKELLSYVKNNKSGSPIRLEEWTTIYKLMVEKLDTKKNISSINLIISGTIANDPTIPQWEAATTYGRLGFEGMSVDYYIDKGVTVLLRDNEIICITDEYSESVTYYNSWIISMAGGNVKAYIEGAVREFIASDKTSVYNNVVADITMENSKLKSIEFKTNTVSGKVLTSSASGIEVESKGTYEVDENCKIYKIYGNIEMCSLNEVLVGYDAQKFILNSEDKISAIVIDRDVTASNIRVLIKTDSFEDVYHKFVTISSDTGCQVSYGNGEKIFEVAPGAEYTFSVGDEIMKQGRVKITSNGVDGKIAIKSIKRGYGTPYYRGSFELSSYENGIVVINELPLEEYLYSVVPSEMPWSYNYEALKAQAICARSFAYIHILGNSYSEYGAHVDDSTSYQVYNNSTEQTVTNAAVDETYGQVLMNGQNIISAYFFSTSCGTTTSSVVWGSDLPYVKGKLLTDEVVSMDLTDESVFDAFIRTSYKTYDSEYPWYRWNVTMGLSELTSNINSNIGKLKSENIQVLTEKGQWENKTVSSVGTVKKIEVGERGDGGVLKYITIIGTDCTVRVHKEYNIRTVISPKGATIKRGTGDEVTTMTMLPSGFFVIDEVSKDNILSAYTFVGGGFGHGVGVSQNGANYMAKLGMNSTEILEFFYTNTTVAKIY